MRTLTTMFAAAITVCLFGASVAAHQITYKGTVVSAEKDTVKVTVVDEKTKKPIQMTFQLDKDTKILRGDTVVTPAEARIQKNEKIAVTIDHDLDETLAIVVRLDDKK